MERLPPQPISQLHRHTAAERGARRRGARPDGLAAGGTVAGAPFVNGKLVERSEVGTVADSLRRILSIIAGVAVAVGFSAFVGFSWWSLALIIAVSLLVGQFLRLGAHQLEVPISAMLVLAVGGFGNGRDGPDQRDHRRCCCRPRGQRHLPAGHTVAVGRRGSRGIR